jgi:aryl-alcohol dehydrogenase-like predicted oxidoreductase
LPAQIGLAWLLARSPVVVPPPGTTNPDCFEEDLVGLELAPSDHFAIISPIKAVLCRGNHSYPFSM